MLERLILEGVEPSVVALDNGTEITSQHLDAWAYQRAVSLDFIRPGKPVENCFIESFNGRVRDECLNGRWFRTVDNAGKILEDWRRGLDELRGSTPREQTRFGPPEGGKALHG